MAGRIVVGIDGSQQSGNALEWAAATRAAGDFTYSVASVEPSPPSRT